MSMVLYARVPGTLKEAVRAHAGTRGLTQTRAVVELLEQGLEAGGNERSLAELEGKLARSASELARTQAQLREAELELRAARARAAARFHLRPTRLGSLVANEYLALLGALGVLAGLALASAGESPG